MNHLQMLKGKQYKVKSRKGASVVFAIVGFMFAAMISLVVVSAAYSNAVKTKKQRYEEQSFLAAQSMAGIVSEALSGDTLEAGAIDVASGLTMSYQYIDYTDPETGDTTRYYREGTEGLNYQETGGMGTFVTGDDKSFHNVKGATAGSSAESLRKLIKLMARDVDYGRTVTATDIETSKEIDGVNCTAKATVSMDKNYNLTVKITGNAGGKAEYAVSIIARASVSADRPQLSSGTITEDLSSITIPVIGTANVDVLAGDQSFKVVTYTVKWPANQIESAASQAHITGGG